MRQTLLGLVVALGVSTVASEARAQVPFTSINDPFFAYYSFYLPRRVFLKGAVAGNGFQVGIVVRQGALCQNGLDQPLGQETGTSSNGAPPGISTVLLLMLCGGA